jgi:dihydrofolate synthase/folylpolyglutamate synthase
MSYGETLNYLYNLQKHGIKFGLDNINRLISALDNPHKSFLAVHVAGTNGKGSTSAVIASILKTAGLKVGLFTSPHIVSFTERIKVDGEEMTENDVIKLAEEIKGVVEHIGDFSPTFFEVVTAIAILYFKREKIDIAVIEVGMGGRLDATNIVIPEASVITNISYDHREFLGNTLKKIAFEKAGIIKRGIPVITSYQEPEVMAVIEKKAVEKGAELYAYGRDFSSVLKKEDLPGICFDFHESDSFILHDLSLPLAGEHQVQNASVAIKAAMIVLQKRMQNIRYTIHDKKNPASCIRYHESCIRSGLENTKWPGRLEMIREEPPIVIDGAHNPAAARALSMALRKTFLGRYKKIIIVLGIMSDKDVKAIMEPLLPIASEIILAAPSYSRAASPDKLADVAASLGFFDIRTAPTIRDAIEIAIKESSRFEVPSSKLKNNKNSKPKTQNSNLYSSLITHHSSLIVITGSFYTIGEAKEVLGHKGVLANLRE